MVPRRPTKREGRTRPTRDMRLRCLGRSGRGQSRSPCAAGDRGLGGQRIVAGLAVDVARRSRHLHAARGKARGDDLTRHTRGLPLAPRRFEKGEVVRCAKVADRRHVGRVRLDDVRQAAFPEPGEHVFHTAWPFERGDEFAAAQFGLREMPTMLFAVECLQCSLDCPVSRKALNAAQGRSSAFPAGLSGPTRATEQAGGAGTRIARPMVRTEWLWTKVHSMWARRWASGALGRRSGRAQALQNKAPAMIAEN